MSHYTAVVNWYADSELWSLAADTDNPMGKIDGRALVAPLTCSWSIDSLPPVATPDTVTVLIYDDGSNVGNWPGPWWIPLPLGAPISVYANAWSELTPTDPYQLVTFQGRIADVTATPVKGGGLMFTVICTSRLADLGSTNAPSFEDSQGVPSWPAAVGYPAVAADAGVLIDDTDMYGPTVSGWEWGRGVDNANVSSLDYVGQLALQDTRGTNTITHYLLWDADKDDPTPDLQLDSRAFVTAAYYPLVNDLAGVLRMFWDGSLWDMETNPDFYDDIDAGIALRADQLLADVGSWVQNRQATVNTVELQGAFDVTPPTVVTPSTTIRVQHADLVSQQGWQSRSIQTQVWQTGEAIDVASAILGSRDQVESGFGLSQATVLWETLDDDQLQHWGDVLWPVASDANNGYQVLGRPVAITDILPTWRLSDSVAVMGRLMGITVTFDIARPSVDGLTPADGQVRLALSLRAIPPGVNGGMTLDDAAALSPTMTLNNIAPWLTINHMTLAND